MRLVFPALASAALGAVALAAGPAQAAGTACSTVAACALYENASSGAGLKATSAFGAGVVGQSLTDDGRHLNVGVRGTAYPEYGVGVFGEGSVGTAGVGKSAGVYGSASGDGSYGHGFGVYGAGVGGVAGFANGNLPGILGINLGGATHDPTNSAAVYGLSTAVGIYGDGNIGVVARAACCATTGAPATALQLETDVVSSSPTTLLRGLDATGKSVVSLDSAGNLTLAGSLVQNGTPLVTTAARDGSTVTAFGPRTTRPAIEDVGEATTVAGSAYVALDRTFASAADTRAPYLVFVTPEGDSRGLYVSERRPGGFTVRENGGGRATVAFQYRIVATPFEATRVRPNAVPRSADAFAQHRPDPALLKALPAPLQKTTRSAP